MARRPCLAGKPIQNRKKTRSQSQFAGAPLGQSENGKSLIAPLYLALFGLWASSFFPDLAGIEIDKILDATRRATPKLASGISKIYGR
jgi:hypothetical protein